jgi:hypothetical protein
MAERRRPRWSQRLDRAHVAAAAVENAHRAEGRARAMVAAVLDDGRLLPEAIAEWEAARRRVDVAEMLEEVAFAALEPGPVAEIPVGA